MSTPQKIPKANSPQTGKGNSAAEFQQLEATIRRLEAEKQVIENHDRELRAYIRAKTDQLLEVIGTLPLQPEELDDETLLNVDPIGIVSESFRQVLEYLQETNANLAVAKDELQAIFYSAGAGIMVVDQEMRLKTYNKIIQQIFFPDREDMLGENFRDHICQTGLQPKDCILDRVVNSLGIVEQSDLVLGDRHYHAVGTPIKDEQGQITHVILVYTDITERINTEQRLRESEERFRTLYATMQEGVAQNRLIYDDNGVACDYEMLDVNPSYEKILNLKRSEVIGRRASEVYPLVDGKPACLKVFSKVVASGEPTNFEYDFRQMGIIFNMSAARTADDHFAVIFEDITERKQNEEKIERLAYFDSLTDLPNRILMQDRLYQMVARAKRGNDKIGLFFLDLDDFKRVNDSFGHDIGDQLLKVVAARLHKVLRDCDSICRIGGDEFVILVDDLKCRDDAAKIARKMQEELNQQIILRGKEIYTSTSIGICLFPDDGDDPDTLLKNADTAMYRAKDEGRNTYCFYSSEMNAKVLEQLLLANDLRKALERDEFYLTYQPQIELGCGQMTGLEALLRWKHSDLGVIQPEQFIPLAEDTGLILPIGKWVLKTACQQAAELYRQYQTPLRIAVNLSAKQFQDPELTTEIGRMLQETALPAELLELEITESILMENSENARNTLRELKRMGLKLSIDDFGTGYSSLSYLRHFPIDRLKVDKSFIQRLSSHPDDAAITEAIIVMAHVIGIRVVGEGVENKPELDFLRAKNCDEVQGFYFSRPLSREQLDELIFAHQPNGPFCFFKA